MLRKNGEKQLRKIGDFKFAIYNYASYRQLDKFELDKLCSNELDIMRNEIYANHGYIFKTKKWNEYFNKQCWYCPKFYDVSEQLSSIERANVQLILKEKKGRDLAKCNM